MSDNGISGLSSSFLKNSGQTPIPGTQLKPGDIVLSAEGIQALKKMNILRLERNNKRDERRKAGEKDVSEDEGDGLAPLITLVPSGEIPTDFGALEAQDSEASKLLFDDSKAALNSFQAIDDSIPSAIFFLAKNGISPPLTIFLPASLARIRSSNIKTVKHGTGESTKVTVIDVSDFPTEEGLDQATWCTTYNTFLTFMELAAGPKIFQGFASHYNYILSDPEFAQWFTAYRDFDQRLPPGAPPPLRKATVPIVRSLTTGIRLARNRCCVFVAEEQVTARTPASKRNRAVMVANSSSSPTARGSFESPTNGPYAWDTIAEGATQTLVPTPSTSALSAPTLTMERRIALATDCARVVTPYHAAGWFAALRDCNLLERYPNLVHDISFGSPIGNPPTPSFTFIPSNMPTTDLNPSFIDNYLAGEVAAGRMSGPYSVEEAHAFFGGHFRTAPLGLVEKEPGLGKWRMVQNNSVLDSSGDSTNSWLDAKDILIKWSTCANMADLHCLVQFSRPIWRVFRQFGTATGQFDSALFFAANLARIFADLALRLVNLTCAIFRGQFGAYFCRFGIATGQFDSCKSATRNPGCELGSGSRIPLFGRFAETQVGFAYFLARVNLAGSHLPIRPLYLG
ncbi:hypothetical protein R3P38DRAFT_3509002 [Favolaschia claudopus]|uniref:Uncharacterized protein n=1 Tax=Favolaschia claudopus TaxID=2862362 RepID=A0AAV9Z171_9AGAR